ncbi:MAG: hypothetical protein ACHQQ3_11935 [Gemmatimonadales bacterium]
MTVLHPMRWFAASVTGAILLVVGAPPASAQAGFLDSLVRANTRVVELRGDSLTGPGATFILDETRRAQFVALGEQHNAREIPIFTTALFRMLQARYGFHYFAGEQDPTSGRIVSEAPVRGSRDSVAALARRYPHAFTFMSDQELQMLADIGASAKTAAHPVWGCDQAFGATHALDRLLPMVRGTGSRSAIVKLREMTAEKERVRDLEAYHYMAMEPKGNTFADLAQLVRAAPGSEAEQIVSDLVVSDRVYRNYREGNHYENGYEREEYMKSRFLDEYRRAQRSGDALPRAVMKFGHWHIFRGIGPSNLQMLGNFVSEFATSNGMRSFHIAIFPNGDPGGYGDISGWDPEIREFAAASSRDTWTIVDLRPLRANYARISKGLAPERADQLQRWIFGFDAALIMGRMQRATYALNPGVKY